MTKSILISLILPNSNIDEINEEIEEMKLLAQTINYKVIQVETQKRLSIDPSTYIGKGKIKEIIDMISLLGIKTIFINDELKPNHYKNIKKMTKDKIEIIDRTYLILNIFNNNAKTNESKAQVKLATLEYMMPRLTGMWTHLERQMGGIGTRGGPGEKQIEIDRRIIRNDIKKIKKQLTKVDTHRKNQKKSRDEIFKISLVGYTNAGKSSILKKLSGYNAYIKDQLFATLETTTKKITLPNTKIEVLISDTVGFIRKLPHNLVASFRTTLSDITDADLIIKVVDISANDYQGHIATIENTLDYLKANKSSSILVFNKIDLLDNKSLLKKINTKYNNPIIISTLRELMIDDMIEKIESIVTKKFKDYIIRIPYKKSHLIDYIYKKGIVKKRKDRYENIELKISCKEEDYNKILNKISCK